MGLHDDLQQCIEVDEHSRVISLLVLGCVLMCCANVVLMCHHWGGIKWSLCDGGCSCVHENVRRTE